MQNSPEKSDNEDEWMVVCAKCGRTIKGKYSRLMWNKGTFRLCGGNLEKKCERLYQEHQRTAGTSNPG